MTKNTRLEIVTLVETLTPTELEQLTDVVEYPMQAFHGEYKGTSKHRYFQFHVAKRMDFMKTKRGNDAPRGGQIGDWIEFNNTKSNRENLNFIKRYLELI